MKDELGAVLEELVALRKSVEEMLSRPNERPRLYEFKEAARLLSVHPKTVSRMVAHGELLPVKLRGKSLIPAEEIDRVSRPPRMKSSGATEERVRFDAEAALAKLEELHPSKRRRKA